MEVSWNRATSKSSHPLQTIQLLGTTIHENPQIIIETIGVHQILLQLAPRRDTSPVLLRPKVGAAIADPRSKQSTNVNDISEGEEAT